jgi:hypothetical protein
MNPLAVLSILAQHGLEYLKENQMSMPLPIMIILYVLTAQPKEHFDELFEQMTDVPNGMKAETIKLRNEFVLLFHDVEDVLTIENETDKAEPND